MQVPLIKAATVSAHHTMTTKTMMTIGRMMIRMIWMKMRTRKKIIHELEEEGNKEIEDITMKI